MSAWDQDYVDMDGPGHITFDAGRSGAFQFGMAQGQMDCKPSEPLGDQVEFTWHGFDEGTEHTGRGHARIVGGEICRGTCTFIWVRTPRFALLLARHATRGALPRRLA